MSPARALAWVFIAGVLGVHAFGLAGQLRPLAPAAAVRRLVDGDADRDERLALLAGIRDAALAASAAEPRLLAWGGAAAVALDDRSAYDRIVAMGGAARAVLTGAGEPWPAAPADAEDLAWQASFGDHHLQQLLAGNLAAAAKRTDEAAECLQRAQKFATWSGASLCASLAAARLRALGAGR